METGHLNYNPTPAELRNAVNVAINHKVPHTYKDTLTLPTDIRFVYWYKHKDESLSMVHIWEHKAVFTDIFTKAGIFRAHVKYAHTRVPSYHHITIESIHNI